MHGKMKQSRKKLAPKPIYKSPNQLVLDGFETPFDRKLNPRNRWILMAHAIPWDQLCRTYYHHVGTKETGREPLNPRVVIGSLMIKHLLNLDDRETVQMISENVYMQYFLGYSSFIDEIPFNAALFVDFRKRLGMEVVNQMNEQIVAYREKLKEEANSNDETTDTDPEDPMEKTSPPEECETTPTRVSHKGKLIMDATACPQDISFPTDLDVLNSSREKSEEIIDTLYQKSIHKDKKPRTYRKIARKRYLQTAQKKTKTNKEIRRATGIQLNYLGRNLRTIERLQSAYKKGPLSKKQIKYLEVIRKVYAQQKEMRDNNTHTIPDRIVSIHQPHVRPIVRGKKQAKVEFGSKIHVSLVDGIAFLDQLSWDAFNEGQQMIPYVELYKKRFGFYPEEVLADRIYCTRHNRAELKLLNIKLKAKPLGRPSAVAFHVSPGERNPIEGKFGQAKTAYGLNRIRARLQETSESWIASIFLVLNLVKMAGEALLLSKLKEWFTFPAKKYSNVLPISTLVANFMNEKIIQIIRLYLQIFKPLTYLV